MKPFPVVAFCSLLLGGVAIGFAGIMMRMADVSPLASAFWRMALATPLLWLWAWHGAARDAREGKRGALSTVLLASGLLFGIELGLWHLSLHYTTVSNATLLTNLTPLGIAAWAWLVHGARFSRLFLAGLALAVGGAALLIGPDTRVDGPRLLGDGLGLVAAVFYGAYQLVIKDARAHYSTARLMAWSTTFTALLLLPWALLSGGAFWPASAHGWLPLLGLALIAQIGGQTVIAYAFAHLPASLAATSLLIQPLTASVAAWLIFGERIGPWQTAGGALLLGGIYCSKRGAHASA